MNESKNIVTSWFPWHFYETPNFLLKVWRNYLLFSINFFSIPLLLKTFFAPWHRYQWKYPRGFDIQQYAETLISNTVSRVLGALCRAVLILLGIIAQLSVVVLGAIIFSGWLLLPPLLLIFLLLALGII